MRKGIPRPSGQAVDRGFRVCSRFAALLASCVVVCGCSTASSPRAEAPPPSATGATDQPQEISKLPPPELDQVNATLKRIFKDGVTLDTSHSPFFVVGDFNGDSSQDIAVGLKPSPEKLAELNEEFPAWILRDLSGNTAVASPRLKIAADEELLAVIHGFGPSGWRDPESSQTYLLKHASGSGMETQSAEKFLATHKGGRLPQIRGDVVAEVLNGNSGFLYFGNMTYSWYDRKTFIGESGPRRGHGAPNEAKRN